MEPRSLVNNEGSSNKFWSIRVDGATHTVHFGRVGTDGQVKTKELASPEKAIEAAEKLVAEKLRKGYRDSGTPGELETPLREGAELPEAPPPPAPPAPPAPEPPLPAAGFVAIAVADVLEARSSTSWRPRSAIC